MDEKLRGALEDAVLRCLEAGVSADEIRGEVEYTIETAGDE